MELRGYQRDALSAVWRWFKANPEGAPLLVLPTGAGKSVIVAEIARKVGERGRRVLVLAHRKELIGQNHEKLCHLWPFGSIGVYSAGLKKRDTSSQVLFAGIQSVYKRADELGPFSLVLIDEAHLVPAAGEGMYRTLIEGLRQQNPGVRFCGLSATPYRLDSGLLTRGKEALFTDVAYDVGIKTLIDQGYLSPLISKSSRSKPDLTKVQVRGGEYVAEQMEQAFNRFDLVEAALKEVVTYGADRKSWLLFAAGVSHAERIGEVLERVGVRSGVVTGETPPLFRQQMLEDFKAGRIRALINCEVLTTGFDHPGIDLIAVLRATKSRALWVQICGRGCRKADGKNDCLILDFGGNALSLGPLDQISISYRKNPLTGKTEGSPEAPPMKECPACRSVVYLGARECPDCGLSFPEPMRLNHAAEASDAPILSQPEPPLDVEVINVHFKWHVKQETGSETLRVDYVISELAGVPVKIVSEWKNPIGKGAFFFKPWWREMGGNHEEPVPVSVSEALSRIQGGELSRPKRIRIKKDGKFWRVVKVLEYYPSTETEAEPVDEDAAFFEETGVNI